MVTLRSIRNYLSLQSFSDVSQAIAFAYRAMQDALDELAAGKASIFSDVTVTATYGDRLLMRGGTVRLPSAKQDRKSVEVTANGSTTIGVFAYPGETINGAASFNVGSRSTLRLLSDGHGGWWG